jgi:hypothetical protein
MEIVFTDGSTQSTNWVVFDVACGLRCECHQRNLTCFRRDGKPLPYRQLEEPGLEPDVFSQLHGTHLGSCLSSFNRQTLQRNMLSPTIRGAFSWHWI